MLRNVPALSSISTTDLLVKPSAKTRVQKSARLANSPPFSRAVKMASTGAFPTFLIANNPNRIAPSYFGSVGSETVKSPTLALTHGG